MVFFAIGDEALVEGLELWVCSGGGECCHEECLSDDGSAAFDASIGVAIAALSGVGCKAGERGCLFGGEGAEFGHQREQAVRRGGTDAGDGLEDAGARGEGGAFNERGDGFVDGLELGIEAGDDGVEDGGDGVRAGGFAAVIPGGARGDDVAAGEDQGLELGTGAVCRVPPVEAIGAFGA